MKRRFLNHTVAMNKRLFLLMKDYAAGDDRTGAACIKALCTAVKLSDAHSAGTIKEFNQYASILRQELRQVLKCLQEEYSYDEVNAQTYPQKAEISQCSYSHREENCKAPRVKWTDGNGTQQET